MLARPQPRNQGGWRLLAALGMASLLAGCVSTKLPEPIDYMCTWKAPDGAQLELGIYGALEYTDVPLAEVETFPGGGEAATVSGSGRWDIGNGVHFLDGTGHPAITLTVEESQWTLQAHGSGESMTLESLRSDPDGSDAYVFSKDSCPGV
jgi:hypothetical protein